MSTRKNTPASTAQRSVSPVLDMMWSDPEQIKELFAEVFNLPFLSQLETVSWMSPEPEFEGAGDYLKVSLKAGSKTFNGIVLAPDPDYPWMDQADSAARQLDLDDLYVLLVFSLVQAKKVRGSWKEHRTISGVHGRLNLIMNFVSFGLGNESLEDIELELLSQNGRMVHSDADETRRIIIQARFDYDNGHPERAERMLRRQVNRLERLPLNKRQPDHGDYIAMAANELAALLSLDRPEEAEKFLHKGLRASGKSLPSIQNSFIRAELYTGIARLRRKLDPFFQVDVRVKAFQEAHSGWIKGQSELSENERYKEALHEKLSLFARLMINATRDYEGLEEIRREAMSVVSDHHLMYPVKAGKEDDIPIVYELHLFIRSLYREDNPEKVKKLIDQLIGYARSALENKHPAFDEKQLFIAVADTFDILKRMNGIRYFPTSKKISVADRQRLIDLARLVIRVLEMYPRIETMDADWNGLTEEFKMLVSLLEKTPVRDTLKALKSADKVSGYEDSFFARRDRALLGEQLLKDKNGSLMDETLDELLEDPQLLADVLANILEDGQFALTGAEKLKTDSFLRGISFTGQYLDNPIFGLMVLQPDKSEITETVMEALDGQEPGCLLIVFARDLSDYQDLLYFDGPIGSFKEPVPENMDSTQIIFLDLSRLQESYQQMQDLEQMQLNLDDLLNGLNQDENAEEMMQELTNSIFTATALNVAMAKTRIKNLSLEQAIDEAARDNEHLRHMMQDVMAGFSSAEEFFSLHPELADFDDLLAIPTEKAEELLETILDEVHHNLEAMEMTEEMRERDLEGAVNFDMYINWQNPQDHELFEQATALSNRAIVAGLQGDRQQALQLFEQADQHLVQVYRRSGQEEIRYAMAFNLFNEIQQLYYMQDEYTEIATRLYQKAAGLLDEAPANPAHDLLRAQVYGDLAFYLFVQDLFDDGIQRVLQALEYARKAYQRYERLEARDQLLELIFNTLHLLSSYSITQLDENFQQKLEEEALEIMLNMKPELAVAQNVPVFLGMYQALIEAGMVDFNFETMTRLADKALDLADHYDYQQDPSQIAFFLDIYCTGWLDAIEKEKVKALPAEVKNRLTDRMEDFLRLMRNNPVLASDWGFSQSLERFKKEIKTIRRMPVLNSEKTFTENN